MQTQSQSQPHTSNGVTVPTIEIANPAPIVSQPPSHAPEAQTVVQPPASLPPPPVRTYTDADLERVRAEEKQKLYGQQEQLKNEIKELKALVARNSQPNTGNESPEIAQLRSDKDALTLQLGQMQTQLQQMNDYLVREQQTRRAAELRGYMERRIRETQDAGFGLVVEMIGGNDENEIEQSIYQANQAYVRYAQPRPATPVAVTVRAATPAPVQGFPTVPNAAPVVGAEAGQPGFIEHVKANTTPEAVRSGAYAANRQQILQSLRANGATAAPLANTPRLAPPMVQPSQVPWAGVQQPQGLPTPPAQQPGMPYVVQAPAPQPQQMQAPQYAPPQPQYQQPGFDAAAARAAAEQAANRGLQNPAAVNPGTMQPYAGHQEYGNKAQPAPVSFQSHPMNRTTA